MIKTRPRKSPKEKDEVKPAHLPELYITTATPKRSDRSISPKSVNLSPIDTSTLFVKVPGPLSPQSPTPPITILVNNLPQIQRSPKGKSSSSQGGELEDIEDVHSARMLHKESDSDSNLSLITDQKHNKIRVLTIGDLNAFTTRLIGCNFFVVSTTDIQNAATVQQTDFHVAFAHSQSPNVVEYISKGKTNVIIIQKEYFTNEQRSKWTSVGAADCITIDTPMDALVAIIKLSYEKSLLQKQVKAFESQERPLTPRSPRSPRPVSQPVSPSAAPAQTDHLAELDAAKEKMLQLESHVKILEEYKKQADYRVLLMEQEAVKLKGEMLTQKEELRKLNMISKWRLSTFKGRHLRATEETKEAIDEINQLVGDPSVVAPLQVITRTVKRLSKVSDMLAGADLKNVLDSIVHQLASQDLYGPTQKMIAEMNSDEMAKDYILNTFSEPAAPKVAAPKRRVLMQQPSFTDYTDIPQVDQIKENLTKWDFEVFHFRNEDFINHIIVMFDNLDLINDYNINPNTLVTFIKALQRNYYDNPYHNFYHAIDVAQMCYMFLVRSKVKEHLRKQDVLVLLVSALCHDLCHPGLNNPFQINAKTELALLYNDNSVLENHHCCQTFNLLKEPANNILSGLTPVEAKEVRKSIISCILATDMSVHFEITSKFASHVDSKMSESKDFFEGELKERQLLLNAIVHTADLSNMGRPPALSRQWSDRVFEEFLRQGDKEKELGLPVSPYFNRDDTNQAKMSVSFIDFVATPLFTAVTKCMNEMLPLKDNMVTNKQLWLDEMKTNEETKAAETAAKANNV